MKLLEIRTLVSSGTFVDSEDHARIEADIRQAVDAIRWPPDSHDFTIRAESGKRRGEGNGVKPIKDAFVKKLKDLDWHEERRYPGRPTVAQRRANPELYAKRKQLDPGAFDCWKDLANGSAVAVEWETGNVSSSHRAMNKMMLAFKAGYITAGYLVLPSRAMYHFLTDRVGNYEELEPYFELWESFPLPNGGFLGVVKVEHDNVSATVERITKGTDGRALI